MIATSFINVRMFGYPQPSYNLPMITDPQRVMQHVEGKVTYVLYTCTVLFEGYHLRVYLSTWNMFEDTILLQYWDTSQTLWNHWIDLFVDRELDSQKIDSPVNHL